MTWFKVDDGLAVHPKVMAAGNAAMGLWVRAGSWCGANLTDGWLPAGMVGTLGGHARDARKLIAVGLWCQGDGGYWFNDWEQYQPTKAQVEADRAAAKERQRRHRDQVRHGVTNTVTNGVTNGVSHRTPTRPDPTIGSGEGSQSPTPRTEHGQSDGLDLARIANILGADERWAQRVVIDIKSRAPANVRDVQRYVEAAIRERPADYRPTPTAPRKDDLCAEHGRDRSTCPTSWHEETA